jgi:hypothetical protein
MVRSFCARWEMFEQLGDIWRGVVHRAEMRDCDGWN